MNIAFVPLRGGSKSIPLKNIKAFSGKPLCYWTLVALNESIKIDKIVVATDCKTISDTVTGFNFDKVIVYNRDPDNAKDTSSTESVLLEYLEKHKYEDDDNIVLAQVTSPFITAKMIDEAFIQYEKKYDSILSVVRFKRFLWSEQGTPLNYNYMQRPRRQEMEGQLLENGAFYISSVKKILENKNRLSGSIGFYEMPEYSYIEIDEEIDWVIAEKIFENKHLKHDLRNNIKLVAVDIDGVLTDGGMYYTETGDELKKFNTRDGMAFQLLREAGIKTALITTEETTIAERRARKLKVDYLFQGRRDGGKLAAALEICDKEGLSLHDVAYIGDDINCYDLLSKVGYPACPSDAMKKIKSIPGILCLEKKGGEGVVREFVDKLLQYA